MFEIFKGAQIVFFGGFDDRVYNRTHFSSVGSVGEEPVFPTNHKGFDAALRTVIADFEPGVEEKPFKVYTLSHGVMSRLPEQ